MLDSSLRPSPRLAWLLGIALVPAVLGMATDVLSWWAVGLDVLLFIAFAVDGATLARQAAPQVERSVRGRFQLGEQIEVTVSVLSSVDARAQIVDEPPAELVGATLEQVCPVGLVRGRRVSASYDLTADRRGDHTFGPVNVIVDSVLGLGRRRFVVVPAGSTSVRVVPAVGDLDQGALDADLMLAQLGVKPVRKRAEGTEMASLRDAVPGDGLRRIDWRATARRGRPVARTYQLERNHEILLCIDHGRLMGARHAGGRTKLDHAIVAALRLAAVALRQGDRVGVVSFSDQVGVHVPPDRGASQLGRLMNAVYGLRSTAADASYVRALLEVRRRQKKRALVVFFTDFVDAEASTSMIDSVTILARRHAVLFVALRDPQLRETADAPITGSGSAYRALAAMGLDAARARVMQTVAARGVHAVDTVPAAVTAGAIRGYLKLRGRL